MARQETIQLTSTERAAPKEVAVSLPNAGRSYKNIKEALTALPEISSSIERKTGWKVDLSAVTFEVVPSHELQRRCLDDVTRRTAIPTTLPQSFVARTLVNALLATYHRSAIAMYLPSEKAVVINEERLRGMSQDAIKSTLHHELTHVAQHQRFPKFMESVDRLAREQRLLRNHGNDLPVDERERQLPIRTEKLQARMSLIEGQAMELQKMYEQEAGLLPEIKMGPVEVALGLTSMLIPGGKEKIRQYIQGQAIFAGIYALGVKEIDTLFKDPASADLIFGKRRPAREAT
ncbi:MAG: hypothetical protein RL518_289 [Pseudomonadota bacterium]|jgi:hypothetical protein